MANGIVLALGEVLWDLLPDGKVLGGAPANFAFRLASAGIPTKLVSRIGNDALGDELYSGLKGLELDLSLVQRDMNAPTGTVPVTLTKSGQPTFVITTNVAYDFLDLTTDLIAAAENCSVIYFGTLIQRAQQSRDTVRAVLEIGKDQPRFLDINLRKDCYTKETLEFSLSQCSILKLNTGEIEALRGFFGCPTAPELFAQWIFTQFPCDSILMTDGEHGAWGCNRSGENLYLQGIPVDVIDTIGSGDSFSAGFIAGMLNKKSFKECCQQANEFGAAAAAVKGGMSQIPESVWNKVR